MRLHRGAPANVSSSDLTGRQEVSRISASQVSCPCPQPLLGLTASPARQWESGPSPLAGGPAWVGGRELIAEGLVVPAISMPPPSPLSTGWRGGWTPSGGPHLGAVCGLGKWGREDLGSPREGVQQRWEGEPLWASGGGGGTPAGQIESWGAHGLEQLLGLPGPWLVYKMRTSGVLEITHPLLPLREGLGGVERCSGERTCPVILPAAQPLPPCCLPSSQTSVPFDHLGK